MRIDPAIARSYYDDAQGNLALAAHALISSVFESRSLPLPPRAYEVHEAAEAISVALELVGLVPIARDLAAECVAAKRPVFDYDE